MGNNYLYEAKKEQFEIMRNWFFERFEDPVENTPYDSKEGGYMYIWGGPYDAYEVLLEEFEDDFPEEIIKEFAEEISDDCVEWEGIPTEEDFDFKFEHITEYDFLLSEIFNEAIRDVKELLSLNIDKGLKRAYYSMLFIKCITIIETYLSDKFIFEVLNSEDGLRAFIEKNKDFSKRTFNLAEIYLTYEALDEIAKRYLGDLIWHNLSKVNKLYSAVLGIDFQTYLSSLAKDINKRHDLVHRNGKNKDGEMIEITIDDVDNLINKIESLFKFIDDKSTDKDLLFEF